MSVLVQTLVVVLGSGHAPVSSGLFPLLTWAREFVGKNHAWKQKHRLLSKPHSESFYGCERVDDHVKTLICSPDSFWLWLPAVLENILTIISYEQLPSWRDANSSVWTFMCKTEVLLCQSVRQKERQLLAMDKIYTWHKELIKWASAKGMIWKAA